MQVKHTKFFIEIVQTKKQTIIHTIKDFDPSILIQKVFGFVNNGKSSVWGGHYDPSRIRI